MTDLPTSRRPKARKASLSVAAPGDRPLRPASRDALLARFERVLAARDGVHGAHCIHELWMRNEPPMNVEAMLARLWSAAADSVPDWLPMRYVERLPLAYDVAARFEPAGRGRSNIYLVLLDYTDSRDESYAVYVGATRYSPACAIRPAQGRHSGGRQRAEARHRVAGRPCAALAYESGCRDLFLGIESVSQQAIDGLDKWSNETSGMRELVQRVHDAGIHVMGAFVFGLDGDEPSCFDRTLEFINATGIDFIVANIIQPYPGTGTFKDAVANDDFLPWTRCPEGSEVAMDYNWPLFDGAHVLVRPRGMTVEQLQDGYHYFLREAYSLTGMARRYRGHAGNLPRLATHMTRNYLLSRYGMIKTAHALKARSSNPAAAF